MDRIDKHSHLASGIAIAYYTNEIEVLIIDSMLIIHQIEESTSNDLYTVASSPSHDNIIISVPDAEGLWEKP